MHGLPLHFNRLQYEEIKMAKLFFKPGFCSFSLKCVFEVQTHTFPDISCRLSLFAWQTGDTVLITPD